MTLAANTASDILRWCERGFQEYDARYYDSIDGALADAEQTEQVVRIRRMAQAGKTLASPRFAYPHIAALVRNDN